MLGCVVSRYRASKPLGCSEREAFMEPGSLSPDVFLGREVWVGAGRVACPVPSGENLRGWRCRSFPGGPGIVWVGEELCNHRVQLLPVLGCYFLRGVLFAPCSGGFGALQAPKLSEVQLLPAWSMGKEPNPSGGLFLPS